MSSRLLRILLLTTLLGAMFAAPARADDYISVSITFNNEGDLPVYKTFQKLPHGCWDGEPPLEIPAHSSKTWRSVSCGFATGTEGEAWYRPFGLPDGLVGRFYWDDPFSGTNTAENSAPSGCTSKQEGPGDGNTIYVTFTMSCLDSAHDGIADTWKLNKAAFSVPGSSEKQIIDLPAMGAVVGHKDVFVQYDWMQDSTHKLQIGATAIRRVVDAFKANGFFLHVDNGPDSILNFDNGATWGALSKAKPFPYQANFGTSTKNDKGEDVYNWSAYAALYNANLVPTGRANIFHYAVGVDGLAPAMPGLRGIAAQPGPNLINSIGWATSDARQTGVFMHEFGHNLGLGHGGGDDDVNNKPNYFSVMNYSFVESGLSRNGPPVWDYSHGTQDPLNEAAGLDEHAGVRPKATGWSSVRSCPDAEELVQIPDFNDQVNWDCDGKMPETGVTADINGDGANTTLTDYDDWGHIQLVAGFIGAFGKDVTPLPTETVVNEPPLPKILPADTAAPVTTAAAAPAPNAAGWNRTDVTVTLTATDDISGVGGTEYKLDGGDWTAYTAPVVLSTDLVHTFQYRSLDRSGNQEAAKTLTIKLDETAPTVTYTGAAATYGILDTLAITCTAADNLSGVATSTCKDVTGPAYAATPGSNAFSATATDYAGNTGQGAVAFTLVVTFDDLCTLSKRFVSNSGQARANSMCAQLKAAKDAKARGNVTAKTNAINAYLSEVSAAVQAGQLTPDQAATLKKLAAAL